MSRTVPLELIDGDEPPRNPATEYLKDDARSVISENRSPDVDFNFSLNPYRGCEHGCAYCYARPTHEYLGFDAGLGFETKILVKHDAPRLFRAFLARRDWVPELIALSGVTDPYQPCERGFRLARQCLQVAKDAGQPIGITTKNALVLRDLDLLAPMAAAGLIRVNFSVTTLDVQLARAMEPRASAPAARLRAIRELSAAGVPVRVLVAPIVPAINDSEIPAILAAARDAGAMAASYILLRLPLTVVPVFTDWLERVFPERKDKVLSRIRSTRNGQLYDSKFDQRMAGTGETAVRIGDLFRIFCKRFGLDGELPPCDFSNFRPPPDLNGQGRLF